MTLGEKIKVLRQRAGLSQTELAQELFVSRAAVAKWENDNGTPDIGNLKILSDYFACDLDSLLDEDRQPEMKNSQNLPLESAHNYCGKRCDVCDRMTAGVCSGCVSQCEQRGNCAIADCCREHNHRVCSGCVAAAGCQLLAQRAEVPQIRDRKEEKARMDEVTRRSRAAILSKYVWLLFWLPVVQSVCSLLDGDAMAPISAVQLFFTVADFLAVFAHGFLLLRLGSLERGFQKAGLCMLLFGICGVIQLFIDENALKLIIALPTIGGMVAELYCVYYEFLSFSKVVDVFDGDLSRLWLTTAKVYIPVLIIALFGIVISLVAARLGVVILYISVIVLFVASILVLYCRCVTAKIICECKNA